MTFSHRSLSCFYSVTARLFLLSSTPSPLNCLIEEVLRAELLERKCVMLLIRVNCGNLGCNDGGCSWEARPPSPSSLWFGHWIRVNNLGGEVSVCSTLLDGTEARQGEPERGRTSKWKSPCWDFRGSLLPLKYETWNLNTYDLFLIGTAYVFCSICRLCY